MVTLLLTCLGVRAENKVVFEEHFVSEPTDPTAVGFYEFINNEEGDTRAIDANESALCIFNSDGTLDENSWWRRAIKFRNLNLQEGKIYRLEFGLKGTNRYDDGTGKEGDARPRCKASVQLMQGEDDADISLLDYNGAEQRGEFQYFSEDEYGNYTQNFYFASEALQKETYAAKGKGELADKYFLSLSVFNPGLFYVKDVVLSEVDAVQSVEFGLSAIKIGFGSNTNIAAMANADPKGLVFFDDLSFAKVHVGDVNVPVEAIEYHKDGFLYIFVTADNELSGEEAVTVSFTNPTDEKQIKFNGKVESPASIFDFVDKEATYNAALDDVFSYLWNAPAIVESYPADRAFAIENSLSEFTFTFDRKVATEGISAVLNCGGEDIALALKGGQEEYAETVVFVREDNGLLGKSNQITLENVVSDKGQSVAEGYIIRFEAGKPKIAEEIYTPVQTIDFSNDQVNTIPNGWTLVNDINDDNPEGELRPSGSSQGSGPRLFHYNVGDYQNVFYVRSNVGADKHGYTTATYGNMEGYTATLPVGDLRIQFLASGYKAAGQTVRCEVLDATGENVLASLETQTKEVTPDGGPAEQEKLTIAYQNETEQNVILRYTVIANGMTETMLSAVIINTYEKTEGDVPDDKEVFADATFGGASNNRTPKAESGWELWQAGEMREFDKDFNYNGTRIFNDLGLKGLKVGYYCNGQWPNGFMQYGTGAGEGAPKLTLPKGALDFTFYAANWKENISREVHFQVLDENGIEVLADKTFYTTDKKNMDGQRGANYEADKFQFTWECPEEANYIIKFGSPAGETFIGNISIVLPGSRAVKFYALLADAVKTAKDALVKAEDPMYDGAAKDALAAAIAKYEDQDKITMTTEQEFMEAINELNTLEKSMLARIEYIPRFNEAYKTAEGLYTGAFNTKYTQLECYQALEEVVTTYEGVDPSTLEDPVLIEATTILEDNNTLFKNMTASNTGVALLTKQIDGAAAQLVDFDPAMVDDMYVAAANNAITDNQTIAEQLKLRLTKAIYDKCVEGDPFNKPLLDPETGEPTGITEPDSIATTNFIQNAGFYIKATTESRDMQAGDEIPGWNVNKIQGNVGYEFSWVGWKASKLNPIVDTYMISGWYSELDFSQMLSELPVGKYRLVVGTQDRTFDDNSDDKKAALETLEHWTVTGTNGSEQKEGEIFSYIYTQNGEVPVKSHFDITNQGQWYGISDCNSYVFDVTEDSEELATGSVLVGAHTKVFQSTASFDNFRLYMVGKADGYDYAAAAAKVAARIAGAVLPGDVNLDGEVNVGDLVCVSNFMAGDTTVSQEAADVNKDGEVNIGDLVTITNIMAGNNE